MLTRDFVTVVQEKAMPWFRKIPVSVALLTLLVIYFALVGAI